MIVTGEHKFLDDRAVVKFGEWLGERMEYEFYFEGELIFEGRDYRPSPLIESNSRESACQLLTFLTLQPGDTDKEYFDKYTEKQMAWARSWACEQLSSEAQDDQD